MRNTPHLQDLWWEVHPVLEVGEVCKFGEFELLLELHLLGVLLIGFVETLRHNEVRMCDPHQLRLQVVLLPSIEDGVSVE